MFYNILFCFVVSDFDIVCDEQARAVKNYEAASQRHAAGLSKEGVAPPEGDNSQDSEEGGDVPTPNVETVQPRGNDEVVRMPTPSRKGKEKVGTSG